MTRAARWFIGADDFRLRAALFDNSGRKGSVVLSPGRTEPIEKYFEVIEELQEREFKVLVHDWRGQGLSQRLLPKDPLKGHAEGWRPFLQDYGVLLNTFGAKLPKPWIAMGHSMGGALTALAMLEGEHARFDGVMLSAPMMGINVRRLPLPLAKAWVAIQCGIGRASDFRDPPDDPIRETFESNMVTHDEERWARNQALIVQFPELALGGETWGWVNFAFKVSGRLRKLAPRLRAAGLPMLICTAAEDELADNAATQRFAKLSGADCKEIAGAKHEILMELDPARKAFWAAFDDLLPHVEARFKSMPEV